VDGNSWNTVFVSDKSVSVITQLLIPHHRKSDLLMNSLFCIVDDIFVSSITTAGTLMKMSDIDLVCDSCLKATVCKIQVNPLLEKAV